MAMIHERPEESLDYLVMGFFLDTNGIDEIMEHLETMFLYYLDDIHGAATDGYAKYDLILRIRKFLKELEKRQKENKLQGANE